MKSPHSLLLFLLFVACLRASEVEKEPAEPKKGMSFAMLDGKIVREIDRVSVNPGGRIGVYHSGGVLGVSARKVSDQFLEEWGIFYVRYQDPEALPGLGQFTPDQPLAPMAWRDLWSDFPELNLPQLRKAASSYVGELVQISGNLAEVHTTPEGALMEIEQGTDRILIRCAHAMAGLDESSAMPQKLAQLFASPPTVPRAIRLVVEVAKTIPGKDPLLELVDYLMP